MLGVFRIATIPLGQNLPGRLMVLLTRRHGSTLVPKKAIHIGVLLERHRHRKRVPITLLTRSNMVCFPEGFWAVSLERDLIWL